MASLCTPTLHERSTRAGTHTAAETVLPLPTSIVGLVRAFHEVGPWFEVGGSVQVTERRQCRCGKGQTAISHQGAKTTADSRNTGERRSAGIVAPTAPRAPASPLSKSLPRKGFRCVTPGVRACRTRVFHALAVYLEPSLCSLRSLGGCPLFPRGQESRAAVIDP